MPSLLKAQDIESVIKADPLQVSGSVTNSNIWTKSTNPDKDVDYSLYISGGVNLDFWNLVKVPLTFAYTNRELTKACTSPFNRLSLTPQYKWVKAYIGYGSMSFSNYTMQGREFLGGGIELTPDGPWRFMAFGGRMQKAVEATEYTEASYKMRGGGFLIGYKAKYATVSVNAIKVKDVDDSLPYMPGDSSYVSPRDNIASSISVEAHPLESMTIAGEFALSLLNRNCDADTTSNERIFDNSGDVVRYRAGKCSISQRIPIGSVGFSYERVEPNYTTLGTFYNTDDFERISLNMNLQFGKVIQFGGDVGYQRDNLGNQDVNTNSQIAFSANLSVRPIEKLNIGFNASNTQEYVHVRDIIEKITQTNEYQNLDTLSYTEMSLSLSSNISYQIGSSDDGLPQSLSGAFSYQRASHDQEHYTRFVSNELFNANAAYSMRHVPTKISATLSVNWNNTKMPESSSDVYTSTLTLSTPIARLVSLSSSVGYSIVKGSIESNVLNARLSATCSFLSHHNVNFNVSCVNNSSDVAKQKTQLSANLTYTYSFSCALKRNDKHLSFKTEF
ncbi:MAG: hypothetical protein HUJ96_07585 [Marinilabiliaceae bacterium]|nr:hypothetical protein [Marinilabiliaceae bacterium]